MKKIIKNKKGFTLIELLAVIVLLAIVGVVGANLIITRLNKAKVDTFVNDYNDIVKEVAAEMVNGNEECDDNATDTAAVKCKDKYDYSASDISLVVDSSDAGKVKITFCANGMKLTAASEDGTAAGTFKGINLQNDYQLSTGTDAKLKKLPTKVTKMTKHCLYGEY